MRWTTLTLAGLLMSVVPPALVWGQEPAPEPKPEAVEARDPALTHRAGGWAGWFWHHSRRLAPVGRLARQDAPERETARRLLASAAPKLAKEKHYLARAQLWLTLARADAVVWKALKPVIADPKRHRYERESACLALGLLGELPVSGALTRVARDRRATTGVRAHALVALGLLGDPSATPTLAAVIARADEREVHAAAALGLGALAQRGDRPARNLLLKLLNSYRSADQVRAAAAAGLAVSPCVTPEALAHFHSVFRRIGLSERRVVVRRAVALAVAPLPSDPRGVDLEWLERAARFDKDPLVRGYALMAIGERAGAGARAEFAPLGEWINHLARKDPDPLVRPFALLALGMIVRAGHVAPKHVRVAFQRATATPARCAAAIALGLSGDNASRSTLAGAVSSTADPALRGYAAVAMALLPYEMATERFLAQIASHNNIPEVRSAALRALAHMAPSNTGRDAIRENFRNRNRYVKRNALQAVVDAGGIGAAEELFRVYKRESNAEYRMLAMRAVAAEVGDAAPTKVRALLAHASWTTFDRSIPSLSYLTRE